MDRWPQEAPATRKSATLRRIEVRSPLSPEPNPPPPRGRDAEEGRCAGLGSMLLLARFPPRVRRACEEVVSAWVETSQVATIAVVAGHGTGTSPPGHARCVQPLPNFRTSKRLPELGTSSGASQKASGASETSSGASERLPEHPERFRSIRNGFRRHLERFSEHPERFSEIRNGFFGASGTVFGASGTVFGASGTTSEASGTGFGASEGLRSLRNTFGPPKLFSELPEDVSENLEA